MDDEVKLDLDIQDNLALHNDKLNSLATQVESGSFSLPASLSPRPPALRSPKMAAAALGALASAGAGVSSSIVSGLAGVASQAISSSSSNYATDVAAQNFDKYLNQQYQMWDRDYQVADKLGLYHPSQIGQLGQPSSTDIYRLGVGSLARMPKALKRSVFTI